MFIRANPAIYDLDVLQFRKAIIFITVLRRKQKLHNDSHRCAIQGVNNLVINHLSLENINGYAFYQSLMLQKLR